MENDLNVGDSTADERQRPLKQQKARSGKLLWLGWGDLAIKCAPTFKAAREAGYEVLALDITDEPAARKNGIEPTRLFVRSSKDHNAELKAIAKRDGFDAVYVGNQGSQHISSAIEFQDYTPA